MQMRSAWIETFGCQMNKADSEKMAGILRSEGYRSAAGPEEADLILINTCSIREKADQKAFSLAGRLGSLKKRRPGALLVLTGCGAQRHGASVLERIPSVDAVVGTSRMAELPAILERVRAGGRPAVDVAEEWAGVHPAAPVRESRVKAWINVMFGCENYCAYCVVPFVRGRERSRPPAEIVAEAMRLAAEGVREATLLGQNVNSYGRGLAPALDFADLLRELDGRSGIPRLRFTTSHPKDFSRELIRAIRDLPAVCEAVHLPLQAGGDAVLSRMNRGYTYEGYRRVHDALREAVPEVAVTSDIIVGFPGETAGDFQRTLNALEELQFDAIFSFRFSPREGTAAWGMDRVVPDAEKAGRLDQVQALQHEITLRKHRALAGRTLEVLVEGPSRRDPAMARGRTRGNKIVNFSVPGAVAPGDFVEVLITGAGFIALEGTMTAGEHSHTARRA